MKINSIVSGNTIIKKIRLLVIVFHLSVVLKAQNSDTLRNSKWEVSLNTHFTTALGDVFLLFNPQLTYAYTKRKSISVGVIAYDALRGYDYNSTIVNSIARIKQMQGIRNGVTVGHHWKFSCNDSKGLYGIASFNLWYLQGDIAYDRFQNSDDPFTFYAPNAIFEVLQVGLQKHVGKMRRLHFQISINTGIGYAYGTNIWKRMAILGSSFKIGYGL